MSDLFTAIDALLATRREVLVGRARFRTAMHRAEWERDLWEAVRPFVHSAAQFRIAAAFMAGMIRERGD